MSHFLGAQNIYTPPPFTQKTPQKKKIYIFFFLARVRYSLSMWIGRGYFLFPPDNELSTRDLRIFLFLLFGEGEGKVFPWYRIVVFYGNIFLYPSSYAINLLIAIC